MKVASKRTLVTAAAITAAGCLMVPIRAACSSTPAPTATTSTTQPFSASPSTLTTPVSSSATTTTSLPTSDLRSAEESISSFWTVVDALSAEPKSDLVALAKVARDPSFQTWQQLIVQLRVKGERLAGESRVLTSRAVKAGPERFNVTSCVDVSGANLVDAKGVRIATPHKAPRVQYQYAVVRGTDGRFYVSGDKAVGTC